MIISGHFTIGKHAASVSTSTIWVYPSRFHTAASNISLADFQCPSCANILNRPIQLTLCGKMICMDCFVAHMKGGSGVCPGCSSDHEHGIDNVQSPHSHCTFNLQKAWKSYGTILRLPSNVQQFRRNDEHRCWCFGYELHYVQHLYLLKLLLLLIYRCCYCQISIIISFYFCTSHNNTQNALLGGPHSAVDQEMENWVRISRRAGWGVHPQTV